MTIINLSGPQEAKFNSLFPLRGEWVSLKIQGFQGDDDDRAGRLIEIAQTMSSHGGFVAVLRNGNWSRAFSLARVVGVEVNPS